MLLGFFNPLRLTKFFRLRSALAQYQRRPGAEETLALSRLLASTGERNGALKLLQTGAKQFPQSKEIRDLHRTIWADVAEAEIKTLERSLEREPRAQDMARLIELHRSVRNFDRCLEVAAQAETKFPGFWMLKLAVGKALYHRFVLSRSPEDGKQAVQRLQEARELKPESRRALVYLAAVLKELGQAAESAAMVRELARLKPREPEAATGPSAPDGGAAAAGARRAPRSRAKLGDDSDLLATLMEDLRANQQVCGAFIFESSGAVLHQHSSENIYFTMDGQGKSISGLARSVQGAAERMGIGRLQTCVIEGSPWWIYFAEITGTTLVVFADRGFKPNFFESLVNRFAMETVNI